MKEKLTNNLGLKLLSVFLAFFIWLVVVSVSNPVITQSQQVELEIVNANVLESKNKTYEIIGDQRTVTVYYEIQTMEAGNIRPTDFRAYIDLAEMYEPTGSVPVYVEVVNHARLISGEPYTRPGVIRVQTEDLQRKAFDLTVKHVGKTADGYAPGTATLSPSYVYVSGPESLVGQISEVGIEINVENASSNVTGTASPVFYDANGNEIPQNDRLTVNRTDITYDLNILRVKDLVLDFEPSGEVAEGYRYTGVESSVNSVRVEGLKSTLAEVSSITISGEVLDMEGATGDRQVTLDLTGYLPEGVQLTEGDGIIQVVIRVEPLTNRRFELPVSQIRLEGDTGRYEYAFEQDTVSVVVQGLSEDLDQLTTDGFDAQIDVSAMSLGIHSATAQVTLSSAYEIVSVSPSTITVSEIGPAAADETSEGAGDSDSNTEETEEESAAHTGTRPETHGGDGTSETTEEQRTSATEG